MSIQLPKAVFFDMDNTILAYDSISPQSWEKAFTKFAHRFDGLDVQQFGETVSKTRSWFWSDPARDQRARSDLAAARREMVALAFSHLGVDAGETANEIADAYGDIQEASVEPYPSAIETLQRLREMGKGMALITNGASRFQRPKIDRFGLRALLRLHHHRRRVWRGQAGPPGLPACHGAAGGAAVGGHDGGRQLACRHRRRSVPGHTRGVG